MILDTNQCQHGSLARVCELCEAQREIERLRVEVESLKVKLHHVECGLDAAEDERAQAKPKVAA